MKTSWESCPTQGYLLFRDCFAQLTPDPTCESTEAKHQRHADAYLPSGQTPSLAWTSANNNQHPANSLMSPRPRNITPRAHIISGSSQTSNPPPHSFDDSVFKPHLSLGNRDPLNNPFFMLFIQTHGWCICPKAQMGGEGWGWVRWILYSQ